MSYATVEEANSYIQGSFLPEDERRQAWEGLDDSHKQILLTKGMQVIDGLPLTGRKHERAQLNAFPRNRDTEVPQRVKYAEIELALAYTDKAALEQQAEYQRMAAYGVSSYSVGNFSETLIDYGRNTLQMQYGLVSLTAQRYLTPWLCGGYRLV